MGNVNYDQWINDRSCCANNFITISGNCKSHDEACSCENILKEIANLHTDDLVLQAEIDELSGQSPSVSGYATEQWVLDQHYITGVDLSDYYTKEQVNELIPTVPSLSGYVTNSELIQYIANLQEQINSLIAEVSGCCGSSGETQYRWITKTGANDYWCDGTTKKSIEKEQSSIDGVNWTDTGNERSGSTILEINSVDCGYAPTYGAKLVSHYNNGHTKTVMCSGAWNDFFIDRPDYNLYETSASGLTSAEIGDCPTKIAGYCFSGCTNLTAVTMTNNITDIGAWSFMGCTSLSSVTIPSSVTFIHQSAFGMCRNLTSITCLATTPPEMGDTPIPMNDGLVIYVPSESVNAYKTTNYWSEYAEYIQGIS